MTEILAATHADRTLVKGVDTPAASQSQRRRWLILAGVTVAVRILSTLAVNDPIPRVDPYDFHTIAANLVQYHGLVAPDPSRLYRLSPSGYREPGFPVLIAAFYWLVGPRPLVAASGIAAIGTVGVLLFCYLVCRLSGRQDWKTLILAWITVMVLPWLLRQTTWTALMREDLVNTFFLAMLAIAAGVGEITRKGAYASAAVTAALLGLLGGIGTLVKATVGPTVLMGVFVVWLVRNRHRALLNILCCVVVATITISPWLIRNYRLFGTPSMATTAGLQLYQSGGNPYRIEGAEPQARLLAHDLAVGWMKGYQIPGVREESSVETREELSSSPGWTRYSHVLRDSIAVRQGTSNDEACQIMFRMAADDIRANPGRFVRGCLVKSARFWLAQGYYPLSQRYLQGRGFIRALYQDLLRPIALIGLEVGGLVAVVLFRRQVLAWMAMLIAGVNFGFISVVSNADYRYRQPSDLLFALLSIAAIVYLLLRVRGPRLWPEAADSDTNS